ncbi:MAG: class I SAM-dependent methyltransferase [Bacteroidota bacterium]
MSAIEEDNIEQVLKDLLSDTKNDGFKMIKGMAKGIFRPIKSTDFKEVYLSISEEQGKDLSQLVQENNCKNIVEFGTSFGISTLFLAKGAIKTGGSIITTELIDSKAQKAIDNFEKAGVYDLIEVRIGDALKTLKNHKEPIDLLLLDGWKNLYFPIFQMLEPYFHAKTLVYVDNADMPEVQKFLKKINENPKYQLKSQNRRKVVLIRRF